MREFLLASFPTLNLQAPTPLRWSEFITRCAAHLPEGEIEELEAVCATPPEGTSKFSRDWRQAWGELKNYNDRQRVSRLPGDTEVEMPRDLPYVNNRLRVSAREAWEESDPLRRERAFLLAQWRWLETFRRFGGMYSQADLLGYGLQLKLLHQRDTWGEEEGADQFDEQTNTFLSPVLDELFPKEEMLA